MFSLKCPIFLIDQERAIYRDQDLNQHQDEEQDIDDSVFVNTKDGNHTLVQPQASSAENVGVLERLSLGKVDDDNGEEDDEVPKLESRRATRFLPVYRVANPVSRANISHA